MELAVARRWKVHCSLLARRRKAVPGLVPCHLECVELATERRQNMRSPQERFHWPRTLGTGKHNERTTPVHVARLEGGGCVPARPHRAPGALGALGAFGGERGRPVVTPHGANYALRCYVLRSSVVSMQARRRSNDPPTLILMSLAGGARHGHALLKDIEEFAGVKLGPGALYGAITRLEERGLIEPLASNDRRRPYRITAAGTQALARLSGPDCRYQRARRRDLECDPDGSVVYDGRAAE